MARIVPQQAGPGLPEDDQAQSDAIAQLLRMVGVLRRRWLVVLATTVVCVAGALLALQMLQPRWRATASIVLNMSGPQVLDKVKGVSEDAEARLLGYREYYQTQRTIMRSRTVAQRALDELGLADDPVFLGIAGIESQEEREARRQEIDPVERLRSMVSVEEVRNSRVVEISAEYPDPEVARDIANAIADAYLLHVRTSREEIGTEAKDNIGTEREKALARVRKAEAELEAFKKDNQITSISLSDRQNVITADILTLSTRTKEAEAERIRLGNILAEAEELYEKQQLAAANLLPADKRAVFETLRQKLIEAEAEFSAVDVQYGPKHEEHRKAQEKLTIIRKKMDAEGKALLASLRAQYKAARQTERQLQESLDREHERAVGLTSLERRYRELEREAKAAADHYHLVDQRDTEIAITNRVEAEGIEILDRATKPTEPTFPRPVPILALAMVAGLGLGSLLALSIDFRDQRIRGLLDLERALATFGLPVLGQLPLLPPDNRLGIGNARAQRRRRDLYAHLYPQSLMAERCRGIRTSLAFVQGTEQARTIMITSPSTSEGKSSTAMNLALSFCQSGKKVALVDADMRRPRIHQVFAAPLEREVKGLSAVLGGDASVEAALLDPPEDAPATLRVLPCGEVPGNPAELLESPAAHRVWAELRARFDVVIIDTPPVLPVTDPLILARQVDGVVVVCRCDQTKRGELQRALSQLTQGDANVLGVVLNEVDARSDRYDYETGYYTYRAQETGTESA